MTDKTAEQPRYNVSIHNDASIAAAVDREVPKELLSSRSAGGNNSVTYLKGDISVDRLNEIFGPLGWSVAAGKPEMDKENAMRLKWEKGNRTPKEVEMVVYSVMTQVTLTIKKRTPDGSDTVFVQTGIGYGEVEPGKYAKEAIGMAVKGAETDGLKRCTTMLGKAFGMFLDQDGNQTDIEYAHKNNKAGLTKAKQIRSRAERSAPQRDDRQDDEQRDEGQRQGGRQSSARQQDRQQDNRQDSSEERKPAPRRDERGSGQSERARDEDNGSPDERQGQEPAKKGTRPRPKSEINENFDLGSEPVTRSDQLAYGATIVRRLSDARDKREREELIRDHRDTITNLEGNILTRLKEAAKQHDIDIDRITG